MSALGTSGTSQGITGALSVTPPTPAEIKATDALVEELRRQNNFESAEDSAKRGKVLDSLQSITEAFVKKVIKSQGLPDSIANAAGGKIFTYGSFRLGVYGPGSDIDTLVVVPEYVTREDYFAIFPDLLLEMAPPNSITNLTAVPDSYVPIIKFEYQDISIDLIFSRLRQSQVKKSQELLNDDVLRGLDEFELRSLNGTRVTDEILTLVPEKGVFRHALRAIKLWAQRRAIYANIIGFPGGVAWAMMVARVCQLYPKATASTVVLKFFKIMENWQWPQPVMLKHVLQKGPVPGLKVWNPQIYKADSYNLMPVITPSFPSMCATFNITMSTREVIYRELNRGNSIAEKIMKGSAQWKDLFGKHTFFTENYKYYIAVISASTSKDAQKLWAGRVESKVRTLVIDLEKHKSVQLAHPFNKGFQRTHVCKTEEQIEKAKSGSLEYQVKDIPTVTTDINHDPAVKGAPVKEETAITGESLEVKEQGTTIYTDTFYVGLELFEGAKSLDLSFEVDKFKAFCKAWDLHDAELNALNVITTRNFDLPDDVFLEGDIKPTRVPKKKSANGKKRAATDDSSTAPAKRQQTSVAAAG